MVVRAVCWVATSAMFFFWLRRWLSHRHTSGTDDSQKNVSPVSAHALPWPPRIGGALPRTTISIESDRGLELIWGLLDDAFENMEHEWLAEV